MIVTSVSHDSASACFQKQLTVAGDPISMFGGEQVRQLVSKVRQAVEAGQFARPPQGPIGSLLTLTDDKWALAVEMSIGKVFGSFIVHNYEDSKVLQVSCLRARCKAAWTPGLPGASPCGR